MSDMRLIVAGAGGRMGRALMKAIAETQGSGAGGRHRGTPGSTLIGQDAGTLAGLPANGVLLTADVAALVPKADGIIDFTDAGRHRGAGRARLRARQGRTSSAPRAFRPTTTPRSRRPRSVPPW